MSRFCKGCQNPLNQSLKTDFCSEECAKKFKQTQQEKPKVPLEKIDTTIEAVLKYMGIEKSNFAKSVSYRHWEKFVQFVKENNGKNWSDFVRPRLRSFIGVDFRYIDSYLDSCLAWGIMKLENGKILFLGLPKEAFP